MRFFLSVLFLLSAFFCYSQNDLVKANDSTKASLRQVKKDSPKAAIDQYRIITLERDTTYVDTSLTIKKEYEFNYLRKDAFGLLPFPNEGQTYNVLQYGLEDFSPYPEFGYKAKHNGYLGVKDIKYYSVATPFTDLYYKTVMEQGHNLDAFATLNTSERFNFSIAYKGLRSLGKYINQLSSTGNFRFTVSYNTLNKRYYANAHFTAQDMTNGENGGITNIEDFESENNDFKNRARLNVYFKDAETVLKGKRVFLDHNFRINGTHGNNNLYLTHQLNYENKFFEYSQKTIASALDDDTNVTRFGESFVSANINDQVNYNRMYNKVGAVYENSLLGKFQFFADDFRYNYYYTRLLSFSGNVIPGSLSDEINSVGGQYEYRKNKWSGKFLYSNSISDQSMSNLEAKVKYAINEKNSVTALYQNMNKLPDLIYNLHQSSYREYNWQNNFKNEKINNLEVNAETQWLNAALQFTTLNDHLYFTDTNPDTHLQFVSPKQEDKSITYLSVKVSREFRYGKFALDNTLLYQETDQTNNVLNVPKLVTRNTLYFTDYFFKKALYLQTGITFSYFSKYYANDYNPVLGEFFVQEQKKIGDFQVMDFFVNARIRQTRIFLKAEHFNSSMTGNTFYSAPNTPYRDFIIRFGLVWNFFQ